MGVAPAGGPEKILLPTKELGHSENIPRKLEVWRPWGGVPDSHHRPRLHMKCRPHPPLLPHARFV